MFVRRLAIAAAALAAACTADPTGSAEDFGKPVDVAAARSLAAALAGDTLPVGEITLSGRIGDVCTGEGCWFVLQEVEGAQLREVFVDLNRGAGFTVPADVAGRDAVVRGRFAGELDEPELLAVGLRVE